MSLTADSGLSCTLREAANFEGRRGDGAIDMLVLHYTGMVSGEAALEQLCAAESGVSCHYLVFEDGCIVQMVAEQDRAWHAGVSYWRGETDINSRSIGIEIVNPGHEFGYRAFPDAQIGAVVDLCRDIVGRNPIAPRNIVAHSDIAPDRKQDPGELFPWDRLYRAGVGHWVAPEPFETGGLALEQGDAGAQVAALQAGLVTYGYGVSESGAFDPATVQAVTAFQRHFRQARVDGVADASTVATLRRLIATLDA